MVQYPGRLRWTNGSKNTRASQSPLHTEIEALIWAMECMRNLRQSCVTFATDCAQLVKMVSEPEEWPAFASYLEDINFLKRSFNSSEIIHIPLTHNSKADSLARSARKQLSFVVHMDAELPGWFAESTWVCFVCWQKKKQIFERSPWRSTFSLEFRKLSASAKRIFWFIIAPHNLLLAS